jgi:hypothetical protein
MGNGFTEFLADLKLFIEAECEGDKSRTPIGLEVSFGTGTDESREPLDQAGPIIITLGNGLRFLLRGRIDRIDQIGSSSFQIIDYKTGAILNRIGRACLRADAACSTHCTGSRPHSSFGANTRLRPSWAATTTFQLRKDVRSEYLSQSRRRLP